MQIVIDIPAEDFEKVKCGRGAVSMMRKAIIHGTPLPDGVEILTKEAYSDLCTRAADVPNTNVGDLISRQAVLESLETDYSLIMFDSYGNLTFTGERIIEAIKRVPSVEPEQSQCYWYGEDGRCHFAEQEMDECDDCISRQAVLDLFAEKCDVVRPYHEVWQAVKELPSVEPERKPGKWIKVVNPDTNEWTGGFKCSECDRGCVQMSMNFCANCGAPMEVDG